MKREEGYLDNSWSGISSGARLSSGGAGITSGGSSASPSLVLAEIHFPIADSQAVL
jgi:hypothetical protein